MQRFAQTVGIELRAVCKVFDAQSEPVTALENISFTVSTGEFVALVGPSGSGKSTLVSILGGFTRPTSGDVLMDGLRVEGPSADRAVLMQENSLFPWQTVRQNLEYGLRMKGSSRRDRARLSEAMLSHLGLNRFADKLPKQLSGGMQKLAELGRALILQPRLLLLDEPLGSVDALTRQHIQGLIQRLWLERRTTVLMVTHDLEEALFLGDRVVVLSPRPGSVRCQLEVTTLRPRTDVNRTSAEFQMQREELLRLLRPTVNQAIRPVCTEIQA